MNGVIDNKKNKQTNGRNSNLELFRIITMLLIVAHHYVVNSGLTVTNGPIYANPLSGKSIFLLLYGAWGKIGINCFVLITGYFMCTSNITAKKFVKLVSKIMIYRFVIWLCFSVTGYGSFSVVEFIKLFLPVTSVNTGFTGTYVLFYLTIPYLNILIKHISEKMHLRLIMLLSFIYIFFGTIKVAGMSVNMNYVSWFMVLYLISSYIRLYPKKVFNNTHFWGKMTMVSIALSIASVLVCVWIGDLFGRTMAYTFVTDSNTFLAVLTGLSSFMCFKNITIKNSKFINTVAASTFGVLLIHANSDNMRQWLWKDIVNCVGMYDSQWIVLHAIGSVLVIYVICTLIDYIYNCTVEKLILKSWDRHWPNIVTCFENLEKSLCRKFQIREE